MTDAQWNELLGDLHAIQTHDDVDRAVSAATRLAELDDPSRLPDLKALVESAEISILEAIGQPIANLEGLKALPILLRALDRGHEQGHDCDTLAFVIVDLVVSHFQDAAPVLLEMLRSQDDRTRANAAWLMGFAASGVADPRPLLQALEDPNPDVRGAAVGSLASFHSKLDVFDALARMLHDPDDSVRVDAASSLGYLGDRRAIPLLEDARNDPEQRVRDFANHSLEQLSRGSG
jgi:HEAT repeat protein